MVTKSEARKELARRELERRRATQPSSGAAKEFAEFASAATQNPAYAQYEAMPAWQKPLQALDDQARLFASGASMGFADKIAAGGDEEALKRERALTEGARNRAGWAGTAMELTGSVATPVALAGKGLTLAGRGGTAALEGLKGLAARTGLMGAEGAGYGALTAAGNDQDIGTGAALGTLGGVGGNLLGEGLSAGFGKVAGAFNKKPVNITFDALNKAKNAAYDASEKAGVIIKPHGIGTLSFKVKSDLADFGYHPDLHPGAKAVISELERLKGSNVTLKGLDTLRKLAGNAYIMGNKANNAAVSKIVSRIDELIDSNNPNWMAGLDTMQGTSALKHARKIAHQAFKMETAENLIKKGNQQADRNITDTRVKSVKSQLAKINDPFSSWGRGFTAAEKAAAEKAAKYTTPQRLLHGASVLNPGGGGKLSAAGHIALGGMNAMSGNIPGLALQGAGALAGVGFQKWGEALAKKSVNDFVDLVARGGVPAPVVQNALQRLAASKRDAITRALMALGVGLGAQAPAQ